MNFLINFRSTFTLTILVSFLPLNKGQLYYFRYAVEAGEVISQHWEERRGDIVHGSYSFLEPNGKIRVVEYQSTGQHGFRAAVTWRNPPSGDLLRGHLTYPLSFSSPIALAEPVSHITRDLFQARRSYPNLP